MSNIKKYYIEHGPTNGGVAVEIDIDFRPFANVSIPENKILSYFKDMILFWSGGQERLDENNGDILKTFLIQLCNRCILFLAEDELNTEGLISKFNGLEGWHPMDGSFGIRITSCSAPELEHQPDYDINEITTAQTII